MTALREAVRRRKTSKVLADIDAPLPDAGRDRAAVDDLLADASWAPFHHASSAGHSGELASPVPWRIYKLDTAQCRALLALLRETEPAAGKILNMLAAADFLLQVTWLPDLNDGHQVAEGQEFVGSLRNMEHIAAAAAAVQSLLLLATEKGFRTYWSSGGVLRSEAVYHRLRIPRDQILLGSVFLFPDDVGGAEVRPGKMRDRRGDVGDWSAWREI